MAAIKELLRAEADGTISFGDYTLAEKTKLRDFEYRGDIYYVKTFAEATRLERNGMFVYESEPGTAVTGFKATDKGVSFTAEGSEDAQITLELAEDTEYMIYVNEKATGKMTSNRGGKITFSLELGSAPAEVKVEEA